MAKGTRAPLITVPFSATSMDSAMPAETMAAPHGPTATAVASDAGRCNARCRKYVLHRRIGQHVEHGDRANSGNQRDWDCATRITNLTADHVQVVPSVVGPK